MAASWKGALMVETDVGAFPIPISLHPAARSRSSESFKTLAPNGEPIKQVYLDSEGKQVARDACSKGIERSRGDYVPLTSNQVARIDAASRSTAVEATGYVALDSLPLGLAMNGYVVEPDEGAASSLNALWNGLRGKGAAYVTTITFKQRDAILAIYPVEGGLMAVTLPFESELHSNVAFTPTVDAKAEKLVGKRIKPKPFDHSAFASEYAERREQIIGEALTDAPDVEPEQAEAPMTKALDLMAQLQADVAKQATSKAKARG